MSENSRMDYPGVGIITDMQVANMVRSMSEDLKKTLTEVLYEKNLEIAMLKKRIQELEKEKSATNKLKPIACPGCGKEPVIENGYVRCKKCGLHTLTNGEDAIEIWNKTIELYLERMASMSSNFS